MPSEKIRNEPDVRADTHTEAVHNGSHFKYRESYKKNQKTRRMKLNSARLSGAVLFPL